MGTHPGDLRVCNAKVLSDLSDAETNREEIESIPSPTYEPDEEHKPLVFI